jgi:hypothetical protein
MVALHLDVDDNLIVPAGLRPGCRKTEQAGAVAYKEAAVEADLG